MKSITKYVADDGTEVEKVAACLTLRAFRWRDARGRFHSPARMATRHLFYTLRMIWNHTMPEHVKLRPYHEYEFSADYTVEYMRDAVFALGAALLSRPDLDPRWQRELDQMRDALASSSSAILTAETP